MKRNHIQPSTAGVLIIVSIIATLAFAACSLDPEDTPASRVSYRNEVLNLVSITDSGAYSRTVGSAARATSPRATASAPGNATITLLAEVDPPTDAEGRVLQASHVVLEESGKYAIVTYMYKDDEASGAVDIFDVSRPEQTELLHTTFFPGFDIAAVVEEGGKIYLAGQKVDGASYGEYAYVAATDFSTDGIIDTDEMISYRLPGYFATDLARQNGALFVTTGAYVDSTHQVGIFKLKLVNGAFSIDASRTSGYPDLRSVSVNSADVAVFEAQYTSPSSTCRLDVFPSGNLSATPVSVDLSAYPAASQAKSKIGYFSGLYFVAANESGVVIVNPTTGVRGSIPAPSLPNLASNLQSSNAVSFGNAGSKDIVLIANGEAGLWVGDGDAVKSQTTRGTASINGTIRFGADESVNFVASKNTLAVAAVGTGGLKVLSIRTR